MKSCRGQIFDTLRPLHEMGEFMPVNDRLRPFLPTAGAFRRRSMILTRHENTELMSGTWKCRRRALARSQTLEMSKNSYIFASISRVDNKIRRMRYFIARLIGEMAFVQRFHPMRPLHNVASEAKSRQKKAQKRSLLVV